VVRQGVVRQRVVKGVLRQEILKQGVVNYLTIDELAGQIVLVVEVVGGY
jgi:hypothetical protein